VPGLVEASVLRIPPNINLSWIIKKLTQRHTYRRLRTVLKSEGLSGIKKRLTGW
jgi:hypothetical protein